MGRRHSKNAGVMGTEAFTYHERKALGFGTVKERLGKVRTAAPPLAAPLRRCAAAPLHAVLMLARRHCTSHLQLLLLHHHHRQDSHGNFDDCCLTLQPAVVSARSIEHNTLHLTLGAGVPLHFRRQHATHHHTNTTTNKPHNPTNRTPL